MNKEQLVITLNKARDEYYEKGNSSLTDAEYDAMEDELFKIDPENIFFNQVGSGKGEVKHDKKMLSLQKTYKLEELLKWVSDKEVLSIFKIDGVSCSLIYNDSLSLAKTRGNGVYGKDITDKVEFLNLPTGYKGEVRGEIYCSKDNFILLKEEMEKRGLNSPSSERSIVAGLLGRKSDVDLCKYLSFFAFDLLENMTEVDKLKKLKKLKFDVPPHSFEVESFLDKTLDFMDNGNYLIDGAVFAYNKEEDKVGYTTHHPKYKMAFKWNREEVVSSIKKIDWQISKRGILTPVANVETVNLSGANVSKVTLHNYKTVKMYNLKKNDKIRIIRSGEVIPKFIGVKNSSSNKLSIPVNCPCCNSILENDNVRLFCVNPDCDEVKYKRIEHFASALGIEDLSQKRIVNMKKFVKSEKDLFTLTKEDLMSLDSFQDKLSIKILKNINNAKSTDIFKFLDALSFKGGSQHVTKVLIKDGIDSFDKLFELTEIKLKGVGAIKEKAFLSSLRENKKLINELLALGFKVNFPKGELKFCITGKLQKPRKELESLIKVNGHSLGSVSKDTSYLVCNEESSSSKYKKAIKLGIKIITEDEFFELF